MVPSAQCHCVIEIFLLDPSSLVQRLPQSLATAFTCARATRDLPHNPAEFYHCQPKRAPICVHWTYTVHVPGQGSTKSFMFCMHLGNLHEILSILEYTYVG